MEECDSVARKLGLRDTIAKSVNFKPGPPYCYYKSSNRLETDRLFFNIAVAENTSPCTDTRKCVCKNGLLPGNISQISEKIRAKNTAKIPETSF